MFGEPAGDDHGAKLVVKPTIFSFGHDANTSESVTGVQLHGMADEGLERLFVDLVVLVEIDGTPGVSFQTGVEQAGGSSSEAPLAKVTFTTSWYVSPVQIIPS